MQIGFRNKKKNIYIYNTIENYFIILCNIITSFIFWLNIFVNNF